MPKHKKVNKMKNLKLVLILVVASLSVSFSSLAAVGASVSSGTSVTTGTSATTIYQHGSFSQTGVGYSKSIVEDGVSKSVRSERYEIEIDRDNNSFGEQNSSFETTNYSYGAGILSANTGVTTGTSTLSMESNSDSFTYIDGTYKEHSKILNDGSTSINHEKGNFYSRDHATTETETYIETEYEKSYSNTSFNY